MSLKELIATERIILTEGAVVERLRREFSVPLDAHISNAGFIYDPKYRSVIRGIYRQYLNIGNAYNIPMMIFTPTWRANEERVRSAGLIGQNVNGDNFIFLAGLRSGYADYMNNIFIGGLISSKGDCYKPQEALSQGEAHRFHRYQLTALADSGVDFLFASTLPALSEATGIAMAMADTGLDYIISFVIRPAGTLLDGTPLSDAISFIDAAVSIKPLCYMTNCVHHSVLRSALNIPLERLMGIQANTSAKSPEELDDMAELATEEPEIFAQGMKKLHDDFGIKILGGCCGTDNRHIECLAKQLSV